MTNEIMETTNRKTLVNVDNMKNELLKDATNRMYEIGNIVKGYSYEVAHIVADIDSNNAYNEDGFKTVHAWTETMFGYKKSASYNLLQIGQHYTKSNIDENGNVTFCSVFADEEGHDFSLTQLVRMLPMLKELGTSGVKQLMSAGKLDFDMSANKISELWKNTKAIEDSEQVTDEQVTDEQVTDEQVTDEQATDEQATDGHVIDEEIITITWKKRKFAFPKSVLEQYEVK